MKTENNKIIAEFLHGKDAVHPNQYHENWNELMEVIEKIETTSYKVPESFQRGFMKNTLNATGYISSSYDDRLEFLGWTSYCELGTKIIWDSTMLGEDIKRYSSKIEAVYNAVIAFIEWYNISAKKNKKQ